MAALSMTATMYEALLEHLSWRDVEQVAFLFTEPPADGAPLRIGELYTVPREQFAIQSAYHVSLSDDVRGAVIGRAHTLGGCVVEVHSHCGPPVAFSHTDLIGMSEWVPHVRWRLAQRPYVALVFAGAAFDALVWDGAGAVPSPLSELQVDGREPQRPSGLTYTRLRQRAP